ncbi:MAG: sodium/glutamate symporter [Opitutaceae bacterium]|nr:sodium/glutamate symporter [Opitutaceae bacterium]
MTLTLAPWWLLALAIPVLLTGEYLLRRVPLFGRYNIPVPVIGGLVASLIVLGLRVSGVAEISFDTRVVASWWTWLVTPEIEWVDRPAKGVNLPFLLGFFTCIGLNATWRVVRQGSWQLPLFLGLATVLAVTQNAIGVGLAKLLGESPLLGLICGSVSLTGGHGTALGFAHTLEQAGYPAAATVGAAAATFGLVFGSLIGGPVATRLIRKHGLKSSARGESAQAQAEAEAGLWTTFRGLCGFGRKAVLHLLLLAAVIKVGAWVSWALQGAGVVFPAYMGAMIVGVILRNALDFSGREWIDSRVVDTIGALLLGVFLAMAMTSLNLVELAGSAGPMLVILFAQVAFIALFTTWVTYRFMGRDYDAAVMAGGHCGFGLGATPNAVANMDSLVRRYGPAPRAYIVVPAVGAMLIDFTNALNITWYLNLLK